MKYPEQLHSHNGVVAAALKVNESLLHFGTEGDAGPSQRDCLDSPVSILGFRGGLWCKTELSRLSLGQLYEAGEAGVDESVEEFRRSRGRGHGDGYKWTVAAIERPA